MPDEDISKKIVELFKSGEWKKMRDAVNLLKENTGENLPLDPYKDPARLPWNDLGRSFEANRMFMEALTVFQSQLQCYLDTQEKTKKRIPKGTPYFFLGEVYLRIGNLAYAREQFLLAFVEDILTTIKNNNDAEDAQQRDRAFNHPAPIVLELTFRMRKEELEDL